MVDLTHQLAADYVPRPWNKPIPPGPPQAGYDHDVRARIVIPRQLNGIPVCGVCHNTDDRDMEAFYMMAHLAARRALLVDQEREIHFLEVGTWCGESAVMIASAVFDVVRQCLPDESVEFHLWMVDTFEGTASDINQSTVRGYGGSVREMCADNVRQLEYLHSDLTSLRVYTHLVTGESTQIAADFREDPSDPAELHFLNIDAGHAYDEVSADIRAWFPLLKPGCWIAGHDYNEKLFPWLIVAVDQLAQELGKCSPIVAPGSTVWGFRKPLPPEI